MPHKCFLLQPTPQINIALRRYSSSTENEKRPCPLVPGEYSYHSVHVPFAVLDRPVVAPGEVEDWGEQVEAIRPPNDDQRWPRLCTCGYAFPETDCFQMFTDRMHSRSDGGPAVTLRDAPAGAMWLAHWYGHHDGRYLTWDWDNLTEPPLCVRLPNGRDWCIDQRASNCTLPQERTHRCWVRHGTPPDIHVDKAGHTCAAGAGSILAGCYHGFLHNGYLTD